MNFILHGLPTFLPIMYPKSRSGLLSVCENTGEISNGCTWDPGSFDINLICLGHPSRQVFNLASLLLVFLLTVVILYQWLVSGSTFHYWNCRRGSIPERQLEFSFNPLRNPTEVSIFIYCLIGWFIYLFIYLLIRPYIHN